MSKGSASIARAISEISYGAGLIKSQLDWIAQSSTPRGRIVNDGYNRIRAGLEGFIDSLDEFSLDEFDTKEGGVT